LRVLLGTLAVCALTASGPLRAEARLFFDPADAALGGATTVVLNSSIGLTPGVQFAQTVQNGVEISFTSTPPNGLSFTGATLAAFRPDGVRIDFDPPVGAVAFSYLFGECFGVATFTGAAGSESFSFPFGASRQLVGANAIGDISRVTLNDGCYASGWSDLRFVPGTGTVPTDEADLFASKRALGPYRATSTTSFEIGVGSAGPDVATGVQVADFLPRMSALTAADVPFTLTPGGSHDVATLALPDLSAGSTSLATVEVVPPPFGAGTFCGSALVNVAIATADSLDPVTADNVATARVHFDSSTRFGEQEICDNAFDDDCDGRPDCADSVCRSHPHCAPPAISFDPGSVCWGGLQVVPGVGVVDACGGIIAGALGGGPVPPPPPGTGGSCSFPTRCAGTEISVSPHCCEPPPPDRLEWLQRAASCIQEAFGQLGGLPPECIVGREDVGALSWMGMPVDPNYKEADPPVNVFGHGYTDAGRTMTYRLHYENVGTADAHDVLVIDPLPDELDESTLVIADGGVFDPLARTITWIDPVVPPFTPRSVSFTIAVRSDAPLGTRIRNVGTIVFPDAVPPTRIDTNFVEHLIPIPEDLPQADLVVLGCTASAPGEWRVRLANFGAGFAYGVSATIADAPAVVQVSDAAAGFSHPDDLDPATLATVMPASSATSDDPVGLTSSAPGDPCETLLWRIGWQNASGESFTRDVRPAPDADADGVPDARDVCPSLFDPSQTDADGDGAGDACDGCPMDAATTGPCPTPTPTPVVTPTAATPTPTATPTPPAPSHTPNATPTSSPGTTQEICGNCVDDDGDGRIDLRDPDCKALSGGTLGELGVKRGVLSLAPRADRDGVTVRGTFPAPSGSPALDPPAQGVTVSFFAGDRLIACFATPPGDGWQKNFNGRLFRFRDRRDDSLADPETDERLRLKLAGPKIQITARFKDVVLRNRADAGEITTTVQVGPYGYVSDDRWRERPGKIRLVTP